MHWGTSQLSSRFVPSRSVTAGHAEEAKGDSRAGESPRARSVVVMDDQPTPSVVLSWRDVYGTAAPAGNEAFLTWGQSEHPITYFVGRNGSGKSKAAKALAQKVEGARFLATDRLVGLMKFNVYAWGAEPLDYQGVPLDETSRARIERSSKSHGAATGELFSLREQPEVWLRVAAFLRRALHRSVDLRESAGFLDPFVRVGATQYSLLRDEGHGLREIVVLLAAVYRQDWQLLVVDEPELHLHPSLVRLWISELERECQSSGRQAVLVSHEPSLLRPRELRDLGAIWLFRPDAQPVTLASCVTAGHERRVEASLLQNPQLVSQLVFSPRPVLVEGALDALAITAALSRTQPPEVVAQTEVVDCGGNGGLAAWFTIARVAGLDVRAIGDLDCCLDRSVTSTIDSFPDVVEKYREELFIEPPTTATAVRPMLDAMNAEGVAATPKVRAKWMADNMADDGNAARLNKLVEIWREADLWLHRCGTLEQLLTLGEEAKNRESVLTAASDPGPIDEVTEWAAYSLDLSGDVFELLSAMVERIAHAIVEEQRISPDLRFDGPVGPTGEADARLVDVFHSSASERHRIVVKAPSRFAGYWVEFDRDTPPSRLVLEAPS